MNSKYNKLINKAHEYASNRMYDKSIEAFIEAFKIKALLPDLLDLCEVYLENDEYDKGMDIINFIFKEDKENTNYYRLHLCKGYYLEASNDCEDAIAEYKLASEIITKTISHKNNDLKAEVIEFYYWELGDIYFRIARILDDDNQIDEAKIYYEKALIYNENHFYTNLNLGRIYEKQHNYELALKYTTKAKEIDKTKAYASYNLGVIYNGMGDTEEAFNWYIDETNKDEPFPYVYYNLGLIYKDYYHDLNKSKESYLKALSLLKDDCNVWYNLGCCYVLLNDYKNATDCFFAAIVLNNECLESLTKDEEVIDYVNSEEYKLLKKKLGS